MTGMINGTRVSNERELFLDTLPIWGIVKSPGTDVRYANTGHYVRNDTGEVTAVRLLNLNRGTVYAHTLHPTPADWIVERDEDGEIELAPEYVRTLAAAYIRGYEEREQARKIMDNMREDWDLLNDNLIAESNRRQWCSEYDKLVSDWNDEFKVFELRNRPTDYDVEVTVTASWTITVRVEDMEDEDAAREWVENMSQFDMIEASRNGELRYPDETDYTIESVDKTG